MIRINESETVIEGEQSILGAELAVAIRIYRMKYGEDDLKEVLELSKMSGDEALRELFRLLERDIAECRENENDSINSSEK